jgi:hypothetical protein
VAWGIVAVLLIALWMRSYWWMDYVLWDGEQSSAKLKVQMGDIVVSHDVLQNDNPFGGGDNSLVMIHDPILSDKGFTHTGFAHSEGSLSVPIWFLTTSTGALVFAPWLLVRFSLRTLLIAMTLVAVGLGLIVWLASAR